jgi:hypothetical protein
MLSIHLPNAFLYRTELVCDPDAHLASKESIQLMHSENGFYAILAAQADADSNQQTASSNVKHATHSATRLGCIPVHRLRSKVEKCLRGCSALETQLLSHYSTIQKPHSRMRCHGEIKKS